MILVGKAIHDLSDIWVHDYHDDYGVHYGINSTSHPHEDYYFDVDAEGKTTSTGITFGSAQSNYIGSAFYSSDDHEHPIIAVFMGSQYIWPSREVKDATGTHSRYVFSDYANDVRTALNSTARTRNISADGASFNIYLDSHQTFNLYKCTYSFKSANWVSVANTNPKQDKQVVMYNDTNNNAFISGFVTWEFDRDDTHNKLTNVPITSTSTVDSIISVKIKPNPTPFSRTTTLELYDQYDQFRGMLTQRPKLTYTINQTYDNIDFSDSSIVFYENDNTNAQSCSSYGPMSWIGGTGWIYFKVVGTSNLGATHIFGEYENQNSNRIAISSTLTTCGTATFNPGTGIWTVPVTWPTNTGNSATFEGTISIESSGTASYKQDSTTTLTVSGISSSAGGDGAQRTDTISISIRGAEANDPENLKYIGTPSSSCTYTQNGGSGEGAAVVTYTYEIIGVVDYATVTGDGIVIWDQNDTGSERTITVKVTCVQTGGSATIECKQAATSISYKGDDGAYITFYNTNTANAIVVSSYGPMSGDGGDGYIYFKIVGKNGNGTEYVLNDASNINVSSNNANCTIDKDTLEISSTTGIWKCKVTMTANPGSGDYVTGTLSATTTIATYENCAYSTIIPSGLTVKNDGSVAPNARTFTLTVGVTDGVSGSVTYTQSPGTSGNSIPHITYTYKFGGEYANYMCSNMGSITETSENKFYWKENKGTAMRGGTDDVVSVTVVCNYPNKSGEYPSVTVYPQQDYNKALDNPQEDELIKIVWDNIEFYDSKYETVSSTVSIDSTTPNNGGGNFPFTGGTKKFYYKIKGTATYKVFKDREYVYEDRTVYFGTSLAYNGNSANLNFTETVPDSIKAYSSYSATHYVTGEYIQTIVTAPALDSNADEQTIYSLSIKVTATSSNQKKYWVPNESTFCGTGYIISLKQDEYNVVDIKYEYGLTWDTVRFSRNKNMSSYKDNPATFDILYNTNLSGMYCQIFGSYNKYAVTTDDKGVETRTVVESTHVQMTDAMFCTGTGTSQTKHVSVSKASGSWGYSSIDLTDSPGVFVITVTGADSDNTTSSAKTGKMTLVINENEAVSYNGVTSAKTTFSNCLTINKAKADDVEGSVTEWEYVKFYNASNTELTKTGTVYSTSVSGSSVSYTIRFTVHGTKYKTINGVKDTSSGVAVVSNLDKSYFKLSVKNYQNSTSNNTATAYDSDNNIYSLSHGIVNTGTGDHTALTVTVIYQGLTGDKTLTNTLTVKQGAAPKDVCTLAFYVNDDKDTAYTQLYEPAGLKKGNTSSSNLSTSTTNYASAMTIYFYSYVTTTVDGKSVVAESIPTSSDAVIDSTDTPNLYKFTTTKNESSSTMYYTISNNCGRMLTLSVRGYSETVSYKTKWTSVIFGPAMCTDATNTYGEYGTSPISTSIGATKDSFKVTFKIKGTRKKYSDGVEVSGSETTVYYSGDVEIIAADSKTGHSFTTDMISYDSTACNTVYSVSASCTTNISPSSDKSARTCGFDIKIPAGSSGDNSWDSVKFTETNGIFVLKQLGSDWIPIINW